MKKILAALAVSALAASLSACSAAAKPGTCTVSLEGNGTTGYEWTYAMSEDGIVKETASDSKYQGKDGMVGAPSTYTWTFEALKEGTVTLTYSYARSWESVPAAETVTYVLTVDKNLQISMSGGETAEPEASAPADAGNSEDETKPGDLIAIVDNTIQLAGNPTTGYQWTASYMADGGKDIVKIADPDYQEADTSALGAGGTYVYTITGLKEGSTDLEFAYSQNSADTIVSDLKFHVEVASDLSVTITEVH